MIFFRKARIKSIVKNLTEPSLQADDIEFLVQNGELAVEPLITALVYGDESVSQVAMEILVQIGEPAVEPLIPELLYDDDDDENLTQSIIEVLVQIGEPTVEPLVTELLSLLYDNENLPQSIIETLVQIGEPAVKPLIAQAYKSRLIHRAAMEVWGRIGEPAIEPLVAELHNSNIQQIRELAMRALQKMEYIAMEPFIIALKDSSAYIRQTAVKELGKIGDAQTVELLLATALKDENLDVRQTAIEVLEQMENSRVQEAQLALQREREQREQLKQRECAQREREQRRLKYGPGTCPKCGASNKGGLTCWHCHYPLPNGKKAEKERGGCLSLWLVAVMGFNLIGGLLAIEVLVVFLLSIANVVFAAAIWNWKKWGAYGLGVSFSLTFLLGLAARDGYTITSSIIPMTLLFS